MAGGRVPTLSRPPFPEGYGLTVRPILALLLLFSIIPACGSQGLDWNQQAEYIRDCHHNSVSGRYWLSKKTAVLYRDTIAEDVGEFCYEIKGLVVDDSSEATRYEDEIYALWTIEDGFANTITKKTVKDGKQVELPIRKWSFGVPQLTVTTANCVLDAWRKLDRGNGWENGRPTLNSPIPAILRRYPGRVTGRDLLADTNLSFAVGIWHYLGRRQAYLKKQHPLESAVRCYNSGEGGLKKGYSVGYWKRFKAFMAYRHLWRDGYYVIKGREKIDGFSFTYFVAQLRRSPSGGQAADDSRP